LENRYHYDELPGLNDFDRIFTKLDGAPLGYWHDTGHAHVNERLTIIPPESLLSNYSDRLIGVHLHDAVDLEDHLAPGCGEINFKNLKTYLKADTLMVLELKPRVMESDVIRGLGFIREILQSSS
jgi:sugar phosphate isomerase/epimerase